MSTESLEAKNPYELRLNQSAGAEESFVKKSLETGDVGFLHSFTTGSAVDGPGMRVVVWTAGCQWRCRYCHNPDTWSMINGRAVPLERAVEEIRKYLEDNAGAVHVRLDAADLARIDRGPCGAPGGLERPPLGGRSAATRRRSPLQMPSHLRRVRAARRASR